QRQCLFCKDGSVKRYENVAIHGLISPFADFAVPHAAVRIRTAKVSGQSEAFGKNPRHRLSGLSTDLISRAPITDHHGRSTCRTPPPGWAYRLPQLFHCGARFCICRRAENRFTLSKHRTATKMGHFAEEERRCATRTDRDPGSIRTPSVRKS